VAERPRLRSVRRFAVTLALSAAGGIVFERLGMPAGWVSGGLFAVAAASLAGVNTEVPRPVRSPVYFMLGIYAGGGVSPETLHQMQTWPASFAILGISLAGLIAASYWWLHVRCGWERNVALLASFPGALSFVMAVAEGLRADLKKVAISQSLRLLVLVEIIPVLALVIGHPAAAPASTAVAAGDPGDIALLVAAGLGAALMLEGIGVAGGWMLGGLLSSACLLLFGVVDGRLPFAVALPFIITLAAITGSRFRPGDLAILPRLLRPALVAFGLASVISFAAAGLVSLLFGVNIIQAVLAFAPGGLDTMVILAYAMNIDPAYVAAHHLARFLAMVIAVPVLGRWFAGRP
jgi:membrane AbrB-like protein